MTKGFAGLMLAGILAAPLAAQEEVASRVQGALDTRFVQPDCKVEGGDFRVSSGRTYLKTGIEGSGDPANRVNALRSGVRVMTEAVLNSQSKSSAAWYWLARLYLQQGDLAGADSAFTRTEALAPGCKEEIRKYRYRAWAALVNAGSGFRQAGQPDSALMMYRAANRISQAAPLAFTNMAEIFTAAKQNDSAITYFGKAAATEPTDPQQLKLRNQTIFNYAVLLHSSGRSQDAVAAFARYLSLEPGDAAGLKGLAQALRAAGMPDSAQSVERQLVAGVGAEAGSGEAPEGISERDLMDIGVRQFNDKSYAEAATTFGRVLAINPWNRDAVYNQANSYLALGDGVKVAAAAEKLIAIEPLAEYDHTLRAQGYKLADNQNALIEAIVTREALPVNLELTSARITGEGATLTGKLTGREARDENNKPLPLKPLSVTVEFLTESGAVVATQDVQIGPLKPGEVTSFEATGKAVGIKAYRYRVK